MRKSTLWLTVLACVSFANSANAQSLSILSQAGFGSAVGLSGSELVVGEPLNLKFPGTVYVFDHDGSSWNVSATLQASDASLGDNFGSSLVLADHLLFVGAGGSGDKSGAVYVFVQDDAGGWVESSVLRSDDVMPGDAFGRAISFDGRRLFVSHHPAAGTPQIFAYEWDRSTGMWHAPAMIRPDGDGDNSGFGASLASDGATLYVGSPSNGDGVVYVYSLNDEGSWVKAGKLTGDGSSAQAHSQTGNNAATSGERFGTELLLSGERLLVTAPNADRFTGRVYSFIRAADGGFAHGPNFTPFDADYGHGFARDVVRVQDEFWVSALAPNHRAGGIYAMTLGDDGQAVSARKMIEPQVLAHSGYGDAMAADGDLVAVGASGDVFNSGSVYVYQRDPNTGKWSSGQKLMAPSRAGYKSVTGGKMECEDGEADGFGCDRVDLVSFLTRDDLGMEQGIRTSDLWGWTDSKTGREYALVGRNDGTSFVDIGDPANPVNLGFLPRTAGSPPSIWRDIKVYKDHAFIVSDGAEHHGMQIFDLHQLRHVGNPPVVFHETAHYDGIYSAHNIVINEESGFAYTVGNSGGGETCGGGSHIINIQDPTHPKFAGCFAHEKTGRAGTGYTHDAQCVTYKGPDERYKGHEICFGSNETAVSIADVSNKSNPVVLARGDYPNPGYTHQGWLSEDERYFFVDDELDEINGTTDGTRTLIWDVAELDDPVLTNQYVSENKASDHNLYIRGHYMYQSNYVSGLRIVDVSDVKAPVQVGYFDTVPWGPDKPGFGGSWSNYPFFKSGVIVVTSGEEGVFVLKRSQTHS